jgi:glycosyltransferase involved in cell wall biosynthesis
MKLLIVVITHNRLEYTKRTLESIKKNTVVPYYLVVVDNASTDGTKKWLIDGAWDKETNINLFITNPENYYPGKACNIGWAAGLEKYPEATHLMRCDNDMEFKKGWDIKAEEYFKKIDRLGQLGLDFDGGENKVPEFYNGMGLVEWPGCVGGPCIIRREIYDAGHRYDETPWEGSRSKIQEDSRFSRKLKDDGWLVGHMDERLSWTFADESNWKDYPEYYKKTFYDRGYDELVDKI